MQIHIKSITGATYTLDVEPRDTIAQIKSKIQEKTGIPPNQQKLFFAGHEFQDSSLLEAYNIENGQMVNLTLRLPSTNLHSSFGDITNIRIQSHADNISVSAVPEELTFGSTNSGDAIIGAWERKAREGDFDEDLYIVDPQAHFDSLNRLEDQIILASELYQCRGSYDLLDERIPQSNIESDLSDTAPWMWPAIQTLQTTSHQSGSNPTAVFDTDWRRAQGTLGSLWKSYLMLCRVLKSFAHLESAGFSKDFFSLLVRRSPDKAEIVKIFPALRLESLKLFIENACAQVLENMGAEDPQQYLAYLVKEPCLAFLDDFGLSLPESRVTSSSDILAILRTTTILLDLGLVLYVGSHGSRLEETSVGVRTTEIGVSCEAFGFTCSLQRLACLDSFLDTRRVWVFDLYDKIEPETPVRVPPSKGLFLLTTMDSFGDLWGPVWPIPTTDGKLTKQYNVSKGVIHPISSKRNTRIDGAIPCHWQTWASFYRTKLSSLITRNETINLAPDDLLLIGGGFRHNRECDYTLENFVEDFEHQMRPIGSTPETWRLDTRSLGLSFSKIVGISVTGTQKKIPETTVKQHILDKWSNKPERANPGVLNMYYGLEISHCTGNARRVSLKDLMLMETVFPLLERQRPGWTKTSWGKDFYMALSTPDQEAIFDVWKRHSKNRTEMADLVCSVLEVLDTTGFTPFGFTAGVFHEGMELAVTLDHEADDWTSLLTDSHLMALFPVVNHICLEFHTPNHSTATCKSPNPTALQTQIAVDRRSKYEDIKVYERIKLKPHGLFMRKKDVGTVHINLYSVESPFSSIFQSIRALGNNNTAAGVERRDQSQAGFGSLQFYICGSGVGQDRKEASLAKERRNTARYHGFTTELRAALAPTPRLNQNNVVQRQEPPARVEVEAPIRGSIIENIDEYGFSDEDSGEELPGKITTTANPRLRRQPNFEWH